MLLANNNFPKSPHDEVSPISTAYQTMQIKRTKTPNPNGNQKTLEL